MFIIRNVTACLSVLDSGSNNHDQLLLRKVNGAISQYSVLFMNEIQLTFTRAAKTQFTCTNGINYVLQLLSFRKRLQGMVVSGLKQRLFYIFSVGRQHTTGTFHTGCTRCVMYLFQHLYLTLMQSDYENYH